MSNASTEATVPNALDRALAERLDQIKRAPSPLANQSLMEAMESDDLRAHALAAMDVMRIADGLDALIRSDSRFVGDTQMFIRTDNGGSNFTFRLGTRLLEEAAKRNSAAAAIDWASRVLSTTAASGLIVSPVWGVSVEGPVELGNGITLIPLNQVPQSPGLRWLEHQQKMAGNGLISTTLTWQEITAALVLKREIQNAVSPEAETDHGAAMAAAESVDRLFQDTSLVLALVGPRVVTPVTRWFTFDDPDIEAATGGGSRATRIHEILPLRMRPTVMLDPALAQTVVKEFFALDPKGKTAKTLRVALLRLQQSMTRHNVGDASVELSIALEALCGDEQTSEMTHKVTVRAVRLLGGGEATRKRNYALIKRIYGIRSKLVHRGQEPTGTHTVEGTAMSAEALLAEGTALCAHLIRTILARGAIPDWSEFDIL